MPRLYVSLALWNRLMIELAVVLVHHGMEPVSIRNQEHGLVVSHMKMVKQ